MKRTCLPLLTGLKGAFPEGATGSQVLKDEQKLSR